jgi:hypothetical protein
MNKAQHPCAGLTKRAREVFEQIAIESDGGHNPQIVASLLRAGVIEQHDDVVPSGFRGVPMTIHRYTVPLSVHLNWCLWCGENVTDADIEECC